ncbi:hypothetical protein ANCCAN_07388 [Ancylostoma caninum]|uniref:Peptidase S1 domain-containing protein n=1 Tax=Ancylostoma caninum TaxID=29170 RepID=A0A368GTA9_ANCCA|nr:hypothetical protein ANCCAN_07388 [Ancylostoma caninum]
MRFNDYDRDPPRKLKVDGARLVKPTEYPWMARIDYGIGWCSGVLISNRHVLTAARCLVKVENNQCSSDTR